MGEDILKERRIGCQQHHKTIEETKEQTKSLYLAVCGNGDPKKGLVFKVESLVLALEHQTKVVEDFIMDTKKIRDRLWGCFYTVIVAVFSGMAILGGMYFSIKNNSSELTRLRDGVVDEFTKIKELQATNSEKIASLEDIVFNTGIYTKLKNIK